MQPVLDQFTAEATDGGRSRPGGPLALSCEEALRVVKDAFLSGAEREISIGDGVEIVVMQKGQALRRESVALPRH